MEARGVSVTLPGRLKGRSPALDHISLTLRQGEHTALLGSNGAGKSTLLRLLRGELFPDAPRPGDSPDAGVIRWHSLEGADASPLAGRALSALVSAAQQETYLRQAWDMTGEDLLLTGFVDSPLLYAPPDAVQRMGAQHMAQTLEIVGLLQRPVNSLSQGQMRLLLLGRALMRMPPLLLLDEYTDGLDRPTRQRMLDVLSMVAPLTTMVVASHRPDDLPPWITRTLHLRQGRLVREGDLPVREPASSGPPARPAPHSDAPRTSEASHGSDAPPLLEVRDATVYVEREPVLHHVNWTLRPGEHWHIQGANGAGKSTFLRLLAGELHPAAGGSIRRFLPDGPVEDLESLRRAVRLVSHRQQALYPYDLTALELVVSGIPNTLGCYHAPDEQQRLHALELLQRFGMAALAGRSIRRLSTGQLRRLFLARALAGEPRILLLDEACSGLDPDARHDYLDLLRLLPDRGIQLVCVTHRDDDLPACVNRAARMEDGTLYLVP